MPPKRYKNVVKIDKRLYQDLDIVFYRENNPDINHYTNSQLILHYVNDGKFEGRAGNRRLDILFKSKIEKKPPNCKRIDKSLCLGLDLVFYRENNPDLKHYTDEKLILHYVKHGKKEGRRPNDHLPQNPQDESYMNIPTIDMFDSLEEISLNRTCLYKNDDNSAFLKKKMTVEVLNQLSSFLLIIDFPNGGGGTTHFINTIVSKYKTYQTFLIVRKMGNNLSMNINDEYSINIHNDDEICAFLYNNKDKIIKIFVNHTLCLSKNFLNFIVTLNKHMTTITHDYNTITNICQPFYNKIEDVQINYPSIIDINVYDLLITQNETNKEVFGKYYNGQIHTVGLPDYAERYKTPISTLNVGVINVGIIGNITKLKGEEMFKRLISKYENQKIDNKIIKFTVIGVMPKFKNSHHFNSINEFNNIIEKFRINMLLELSIWPETYSYTTTLAMLTGLPILVYDKPFNSVIKSRLRDYTKAMYFQESNIDKLTHLFAKYQNYLYLIKPIIYFNKWWTDYFVTSQPPMPEYTITQQPQFKHDIKPFFIYFPQFHEIEENNLTFYKGYTDIINLKHLSISDHPFANTEQPSLTDLGIDSLEKYNLSDINVIQKQIDIICHYNMPGFAIYYYWFSENTITNKKMVMETVINNFFSSEVDMKQRKVFFIWANESWSSNAAFGNSGNHKVINEYTYENIVNNIENMIIYFKHDNYLKIDNKPVFFIYHSHFMRDEEIDLFHRVLVEKCLVNQFDGVHFVLNNMVKKYPTYNNFYLNFNYKQEVGAVEFDKSRNHCIIDYNKYLDNSAHVESAKIQTMVYDFNNIARLFIPDRRDCITTCTNNTEVNKILFTNKIIQTYNRPNKCEIDNIMLVNAFNEWGEKMTFEPSNKYGYYNMNLLYKRLLN